METFSQSCMMPQSASTNGRSPGIGANCAVIWAMVFPRERKTSWEEEVAMVGSTWRNPWWIVFMMQDALQTVQPWIRLVSIATNNSPCSLHLGHNFLLLIPFLSLAHIIRLPQYTSLYPEIKEQSLYHRRGTPFSRTSSNSMILGWTLTLAKEGLRTWLLTFQSCNLPCPLGCSYINAHGLVN